MGMVASVAHAQWYWSSGATPMVTFDGTWKADSASSVTGARSYVHAVPAGSNYIIFAFHTYSQGYGVTVTLDGSPMTMKVQESFGGGTSIVQIWGAATTPGNRTISFNVPGLATWGGFSAVSMSFAGVGSTATPDSAVNVSTTSLSITYPLPTNGITVSAISNSVGQSYTVGADQTNYHKVQASTGGEPIGVSLNLVSNANSYTASGAADSHTMVVLGLSP